MQVHLKTIGNPDFGQDSTKPMKGVSDAIIDCSTLQEASNICRDWIIKNQVGGGNWIGGQVIDGTEQIANVSYNGRIWNMDGTEAF